MKRSYSTLIRITKQSLVPYPHPISVNKILVFNRMRRGFRCKFFILMKLFADSRQQRSYGVFWEFVSLWRRAGLSLLDFY